MNQRYMVNAKTGVIFSYNPESMKANKNLAECNKDGVIIGRSGTPLDDLYAEIDRLQKENAEKDLRISILEASIETLENEKIARDPKNIRRRELEDMTLEMLKEITASLGITVKGNKADFIEAIISTEYTE